MKNYKISDIARLANTTVKSLRVYEEKGILSPVRHHESNYRLYSESAVSVVKNIKLLQSLGLSLKEISMIHQANSLETDGLKSLLVKQIDSTEKQLSQLHERKLILTNIVQKIDEGDLSSSHLLTAKEKDIFMGITTGFSKLDNLLKSESKGQLVVIAARPGLGKTSLTINIAYSIMEQTGKCVAFFSTEYDHREWTRRIAVQRCMQNFGADYTEDQFEITYKEIQTRPINYRYSNTIAVDEIVERTSALKRKQGAIVVDYLQDLQGDSELKCKKLKELALKLDCPILVIGTVSEKADERADRRPVPEDVNNYTSMVGPVDKLLVVSSPSVLPKSSSKVVANVDVYSNDLEEKDQINLIWDGAYCGYSDKV